MGRQKDQKDKDAVWTREVVAATVGCLTARILALKII
jgi:hypothetical protein